MAAAAAAAAMEVTADGPTERQINNVTSAAADAALQRRRRRRDATWQIKLLDGERGAPRDGQKKRKRSIRWQESGWSDVDLQRYNIIYLTTTSTTTKTTTTAADAHSCAKCFDVGICNRPPSPLPMRPPLPHPSGTLPSLTATVELNDADFGVVIYEENGDGVRIPGSEHRTHADSGLRFRHGSARDSVVEQHEIVVAEVGRSDDVTQVISL